MNVPQKPTSSRKDAIVQAEIASIQQALTLSIRDANNATMPCRDKEHQVSSIDLVGDTAAALVDFTDCSGSSFTDLYVLQKHDNTWAVDSKAWDSHAFN